MSVELVQAMGWYEYKKDKWKSTIRERYGHFQGYPVCALSLYRDKKDIKGKKEPSFRHDLSKCTNVELKGRRLDRNFCLKYTVDNIHYAIWLPNAKEQQLWYEAIFSCIKKPKKRRTGSTTTHWHKHQHQPVYSDQLARFLSQTQPRSTTAPTATDDATTDDVSTDDVPTTDAADDVSATDATTTNDDESPDATTTDDV